MDVEQIEVFIAWLDKQLAEKNMTDNQLAKRAGLGHSSLSKARKGSLPGFKACISIARALNVSEIEALRAAGHLPTPSDYSPDREALIWECEQLPEHLTYMARQVVRAMSEADKRSGKSG